MLTDSAQLLAVCSSGECPSNAVQGTTDSHCRPKAADHPIRGCSVHAPSSWVYLIISAATLCLVIDTK